MNIREVLGFSERLFELGVVTPEDLSRMEREWDSGEDTNTEHYRWSAFCDFVKAHDSFSPEVLNNLYDLGASDPDAGMGGSMMVNILQRSDCPRELLRRALNSEEKFLRRVAARRLGIELIS